VSYQNALTSRNAFFFQNEDKRVTDEFFLNYWYRWMPGQLSRSSEYTKSIGRSPYDVYAGVEMEKSAEDILNSASVSSYWPEIFPERKPHNHSIGLFCPDATTFRRAKDMDDFYLRSNQFWTGQNGDPSNTQTDFHWKGMAHYIPAQTAITTLPFVSNFCTGHGDKFFVEGENRRQSEWANRTFQDIMPTWRWLIKTTGTRLKTEFDWSDAYYGSNCIKVSGNLVADNDLKLFMTELPVSANTQLNLVYKSGKSNVATHMKVGIAFKGAEDVVQYYPVGNSTSEFWNTCKIDLSAHTGKTIAAISVMFEGTGGADYIMKLGRIAVLDGDPVKPSAPSGLTVDSKKETSVDVGTVLLSWNHSSDINNYNIYYYNVYRRNKDNSLTHLGGSTCDGYFVQEVHREGEEETATIVVEAVSLDFAFSETTSTTITWDRPTTLLSAKFSADRPKCFTSQEVHFSDESLNGPTEWLWSFPGGTPSTSTEKNPIVVYNAVGAYDVSLSIKNDTEASKLIKTAYISIEENRKPVADFSVDDNEVLINKEVRFLLNSPAAQSYEWNFPGGTPSKSSEKNPTVYYESAGQYDVTLKVVNNLGESTKTSTSLINVREASNKVLNLGDSDYLNIDKPNELFGADECTIEMWFKIDPNFTVASKGFVGLFKTVNTTTNRLALNLSKALDKFQVLWGNGYNGYGNFNTTINKDTWYHLALVYDNNKVGSGRVVLYLNGERLVSNGIASGNWEGLVPDVNMDMKVMEGVNGQLDNFRIWKSALSLTQLNEVSLKTINASHSLSDKLITQYTFEKQFGNTFLNTKDDSKYVATLMPESYSDLVKLIGVEKPAIDNTDLPTLISIDPINKDIRISPNPVVDEFKINGVLSAYDYSIYNVTGLLVMKGKANGQSVDVSHLSSGIYIVLINNGAVLKFIKK